MLHGEIERSAVGAGLAAGHDFLKHYHAIHLHRPAKAVDTRKCSPLGS
jgi:hypothetical protein